MTDRNPIGKSEPELLAKLEQWLAKQHEDPTIFDVRATGDIELFAAYVLQQARAATRQAALENIWVEPGYDFVGEHSTARLIGAFAALAECWGLSLDETLGLLGLKSTSELDELLALPLRDVPISMIERIATLFRISQSLGTLLPNRSAADGWVKRPNKARMFGGSSALEFMLANDLEGIRQVSAYLLAQIWSA